jgi:ABC-2 type transport system ATP-binding protein
MNRTAIMVRDVKKVFYNTTGVWKRKVSAHWALDGVSFDVRECESYALLGPNGSGKSTLIRILSTLLTHERGVVEIEGLRLPGEAEKIRERVGRMSADAAAYKKMSARENLLYSAFMYGHRRAGAMERANDILGQLGFPAARLNEPLEQMSRGMQQKVAIARALLINPPILLLDEPTTGLDPKSKRDVQRFLENLRRQHGTTILLTTHDLAEAERLSERIGLLAHGKLVAEGTADELRAQAGTSSLDEAFIRLIGEQLADDHMEEKIPA